MHRRQRSPTGPRSHLTLLRRQTRQAATLRWSFSALASAVPAAGSAASSMAAAGASSVVRVGCVCVCVVRVRVASGRVEALVSQVSVLHAGDLLRTWGTRRYLATLPMAGNGRLSGCFVLNYPDLSPQLLNSSTRVRGYLLPQVRSPSCCQARGTLPGLLALLRRDTSTYLPKLGCFHQALSSKQIPYVRLLNHTALGQDSGRNIGLFCIIGRLGLGSCPSM